MSQKFLDEYLIPKYTQMGFTPPDITKAWEASSGDENKILDILFNLKYYSYYIQSHLISIKVVKSSLKK